MQNMVLGWLIYGTTQSSIALGLVAFCSFAPVVLLSVYAGTRIDRTPIKRMLVWIQLFAIIQPLLLGWLVLTGKVAAWHVIVLSLFLGVIQAFDIPARNTLLRYLVPEGALANAVALNASILSIARLLGPAMAGWMVVKYGEAPVFFLNAGSFLFVLVAIALLNLPDEALMGSREQDAGRSAASEVLDSLRYAWADKNLRRVLWIAATASISSSAVVVLLPALVRDVFGSGVATLGAIMGAIGLGALCSNIVLAQLGGGSARTMSLLLMVSGFALVFFVGAQELTLVMLFAGLAAFGLTSLVTLGNALIQLRVTDRQRGRLMGVYAMVTIGSFPVGGLIVSVVAEWLGPRSAVLGLALMCVSAGAVSIRRSAVE